MISLINVYDEPEAEKVLFDLLLERTPEQSISHLKMPTYDEHVAFVRSKPYQAWYLILHQQVAEEPMEDVRQFVGATYLTRQREIGLFIFNAYQDKGFGSLALIEMRRRHGEMLANISPYNTFSQRFFTKHGGKLIQLTYRLSAL